MYFKFWVKNKLKLNKKTKGKIIKLENPKYIT